MGEVKEGDRPHELSLVTQGIMLVVSVVAVLAAYIGWNAWWAEFGDRSVDPPAIVNAAQAAKAAEEQTAIDVQERVRAWCDGNGLGVSAAIPDAPGLLTVRVPREVSQYDARVIAGKCYQAAKYEDAWITVQDGSGMDVAKCNAFGPSN